MNLKPEDRIILSSIKIEPSQLELEQINSLIPLITDWDYLVNTIIDRGIGPLLFKKLPFLTNSSQIPEEVKTKLQQVYFKTLSRSMVLYEHFRKITDSFSLQGIPVIALKGIYLSEWLYQDIGLRQFSDIDLLVKEEDGEKCISILREFGYKQYDNTVSEFVGSQLEIVHYFPMILNGVSVELHIKLHKKNESYDLNINNLWLNSQVVNLNYSLVHALNQNDLLIHLCVHLDKHFKGADVQFTCFNDITNILCKYSNTMNWTVLVEACRLYKCEDVVFKYLLLVNKYMNAPVPSFIVQKYAYLLLEKDELLFFKYLGGYTGSFTAVPTHFQNLNKLETLSDQFRYIWDLLFPPKSFMIPKYNIKHHSLIPFYYPYRYFAGFKGIIRYIKDSLSKNVH